MGSLSSPALQSIFDQAMALVSQAGGDGLLLMVEADNPAIASLWRPLNPVAIDWIAWCKPLYAGVPDSQLQAMGSKTRKKTHLKA